MNKKYADVYQTVGLAAFRDDLRAYLGRTVDYPTTLYRTVTEGVNNRPTLEFPKGTFERSLFNLTIYYPSPNGIKTYRSFSKGVRRLTEESDYANYMFDCIGDPSAARQVIASPINALFPGILEGFDHEDLMVSMLFAICRKIAQPNMSDPRICFINLNGFHVTDPMDVFIGYREPLLQKGE